MSGEVQQYGQTQSLRRPLRIREGVITSRELADEAVTEAKLASAVQTKLNASEVEIQLITAGVTLPVTGLSTDTLYVYKNISVNTVTLTGTIDSVASFDLLSMESVTLVWDGTQFWIT